MSRKGEAIKLKLQKSRLLMMEVETLLAHKFYNTLINRLYYSCYHATKALLLTKDLVSKTHSGSLSLLNQKFVQENKFDQVQATFFKSLMNERVESDYDDFMIYDEALVISFIEPAKKYQEYVFNLVEKYLEENADDNPDQPGMFHNT
jgi:uncharacterized protein (UPF0332 family)